TDPRLCLVTVTHRGKGAAVARGMLRANGAIRMMCDADLSMPAREIPKLLAPIAAGADVAIATREGAGARRIGEPYRRQLMGRGFNAMVRALAVPGLHDTQCGFKAFSADSAALLFGRTTIDGFGFDVEVLFIARQHGLRVAEVPIAWYYQASSRVSPVRDT